MNSMIELTLRNKNREIDKRALTLLMVRSTFREDKDWSELIPVKVAFTSPPDDEIFEGII